MDLPEKKKVIAANFSKYAASYDTYAEAQKIGAAHLVQKLKTIQEDLPYGPILEIGCGTGFVSQDLVEMFSGRDIRITDISKGMLDICQKKISHRIADKTTVSWEICDGETVSRGAFALIVSSFTFQWFEDLKKSMTNFREALAPGGRICCSFLGEGSFREWKEICEAAGIPYTGNPLARKSDIEEALSHPTVSLDFFQEDVVICYSSPMDFFRALKKIGAGTNTKEQMLRPDQLKKLMKYWQKASPDGTAITYEINYALVKKNE